LALRIGFCNARGSNDPHGCHAEGMRCGHATLRIASSLRTPFSRRDCTRFAGCDSMAVYTFAAKRINCPDHVNFRGGHADFADCV
jgi:hypothetical protein